ncbi:hypothetical protein [Flavobacterium restrictum]|nr:hypothetical protein [Flavobacterium restrictum]
MTGSRYNLYLARWAHARSKSLEMTGSHNEVLLINERQFEWFYIVKR